MGRLILFLKEDENKKDALHSEYAAHLAFKIDETLRYSFSALKEIE
jgi:hypothetical protein